MIFIIPKVAPRSSPHKIHGKLMIFHDDQNMDFRHFLVKSKQIRIDILIGRGYVLQVLKLGQLQACLPIGGPASAPKRRPQSGDPKACHDRIRFLRISLFSYGFCSIFASTPCYSWSLYLKKQKDDFSISSWPSSAWLLTIFSDCITSTCRNSEPMTCNLWMRLALCSQILFFGSEIWIEQPPQ